MVWAHNFCSTTTKKTNVDNLRVFEPSGTWKWIAASTWSLVLFSAVQMLLLPSFCRWIQWLRHSVYAYFAHFVWMPVRRQSQFFIQLYRIYLNLAQSRRRKKNITQNNMKVTSDHGSLHRGEALKWDDQTIRGRNSDFSILILAKNTMDISIVQIQRSDALLFAQKKNCSIISRGMSVEFNVAWLENHSERAKFLGKNVE